ncbi:Syntaxin-18 [Acipenser ruthenus]|uniref:Syntaxin-18 n=1 Tax=Acipenser ruthenus TaxID=7906 RepID=A0A662YRQ7_ACIRT|nr:Syntaxin-18 [Acipenser ruthenus]
MVVDITLLFKASVKTVKTRNKAIGVCFDSAKDEILKKSRPKSDFSSRAKEVIANITKLKDFLLEHRKDYINAGSLISSDYSHMSDNDRDQIDQDAQIFMRACSDAIRQLRSEGVCKLYSEQRAIRVKRVVDKKRLSRLEPEQNKKRLASATLERTTQSSTEQADEKVIKDESSDKNITDVQDTSFGLWEDGKVEDELSPEEIQMFEQENQRLVGEMNNLVDEVRQIEGKVVEISRLQEIFAEKVLQQESEIDNIHELVVGATENVKEGNEDIREAIKNNAGFRVWILFFLVMCSFSLLFLDWYGS